MALGRWLRGLFGRREQAPGDAPEAQPEGAPDAASGAEAAEPTVTERIEALQRQLAAPLDERSPHQDLAALYDSLVPLDGETAFLRDLDELAALDPAAAIRSLRRYETALPGHPAILLRLGRLYDSRRDHDAARNVLERLAEHPRVGAEANERLGTICERAGQPALAVVYYQRALALDWGRRHLLDACYRLESFLAEPPPPPPLSIVTHEPPPGFRLEHPLGRGGFGTVYLGRDEALDRPVAMKFLHPHLRRRPDKVEALFAEARLIASFDTRGVVGLYELDRERHLMILEYMTHGTLADRLAAGRGLAPRATFTCLRRVCQVLAIVHARGIVHRDIKPANVLFRGEVEPVLGDFGIAGLEEEGRQHAGTRLYAAPETLAGAVPDRRADLYAVGLLMAEMLTAQRPPLDPAGLAPWLALAASTLPDRLQAPALAFLQRLCAAEPGQRPASAEEVASVLELAELALTEADAVPAAARALVGRAAGPVAV